MQSSLLLTHYVFSFTSVKATDVHNMFLLMTIAFMRIASQSHHRKSAAICIIVVSILVHVAARLYVGQKVQSRRCKRHEATRQERGCKLQQVLACNVQMYSE